jgi:hypothetical protein
MYRHTLFVDSSIFAPKNTKMIEHYKRERCQNQGLFDGLILLSRPIISSAMGYELSIKLSTAGLL